jgi:hypothetical protein
MEEVFVIAVGEGTMMANVGTMNLRRLLRFAKKRVRRPGPLMR